MTTEISVMYGSEKVNSHIVLIRCDMISWKIPMFGDIYLCIANKVDYKEGVSSQSD